MERVVVLLAVAGATLSAALTAATFALHRSSDPVATAAEVPEAIASTSRPWRFARGKGWQIASDGNAHSEEGEAPEITDAAEGTRGACPTGMVEVQGRMHTEPPPGSGYGGRTIDELQQSTCIRWISREFPERCAEFDRDRWLVLAKDLPTRAVHVCMDRFEYPNRRGAFPMVLVNWHEAAAACDEQGKRLCTEDEWTFACEGEETSPYPAASPLAGYVRDPTACLNDRPWRAYDDRAFSPRDGRRAVEELDRLWQGEASGSRPLCRSAFGVYDLTGNVDEWTRSSREGERPSVLKGGYWGPVRTRCRPATRAHGETHAFYQQGFRCCSAPR